MSLTTDRKQQENACGYVAARAVVSMHTAHATGGDWQTCELGDAADARWVRDGNALLSNELVLPRDGRPNITAAGEAALLAPWHVQALIRGFARQDAGLPLGLFDQFDQIQSAWMPVIATRDAVVASIVRDLHMVASGEEARVPLKFFVANSHDSDSLLGHHWATIALAIEPKVASSPNFA